MNPDRLRLNPGAVQFVRQFFEDGVVRGFTMTSYPSLRTALQNAGAAWVDRDVVVDRGIVSSRRPADLPAFIDRMLEEFAEGRHGSAGRRRPAHALA